MCDLEVTGGGSVFLLHPRSDAGRAWIAEHIPEDAMMLGNAVAVEHRYIADIVAGAMSDDLCVQ